MIGSSKHPILGMRDSVTISLFIVLVACFLLGGASRLHELRLAVVELIALPLLVLAIMALLATERAPRHRLAYLLIAATALIPLIQLIPLPPLVWERLPGRDQLTLGLDVTSLQATWSPLSLSPDKTWRSFLALLPPIAVFLGVLALPQVDAVKRLTQAIIAATVLSVVLGTLQLASGTDSLYPWPTTNAGSMTGLFANRNHLATLCLISIPFAAVFGAANLRKGRSRVGLWLSVFYIAFIAIALCVIRSRAGIILFAPVLAGSVFAAWTAAGRGRPKPVFLGVVGLAVLAIAAMATLAVPALLERFDAGAAPEGRFENWPIVLAAADTYLPFGSGIGSFDTVYRSVEPLQHLDATFFNQAHNDYLETWLETGWFGAFLLVAFLFWFGKRSMVAWKSGVSTQRDLQRAASIAITAVLIHSAIDYPMRTIMIASVFALCCALLELAIRSDAEFGRSGRADRGRGRPRTGDD